MFTATVRDIKRIAEQQNKLLTIKDNATVSEAARKMTDNHVGCLVVFNSQGEFVGVFTERDILAKVTTKNVPPHNLLVSNVMTTKPISCTLDTTIEKVEQLMAEHQIRHLPILEDGRPAGMVSSRDVIAYQLHNNKDMKAAAEQLAMLSTELKNLNLKDVIALAINEVPRNFDANCALLCLPKRTSSDLVVYRRDCTIPKGSLLDPESTNQLPKNGPVISADICEECKKLGGKDPKLVIPLTLEDQSDNDSDNNTDTSGFLCMCRFDPSALCSEKLRLYKASLMQEILSVNLTNARLYQNYQKARHDSEIDPLTGVGTRRVLEQILNAEYARALRYNHSFSVAIVDIDNFKQINDTAGHAAGDRALRRVAKTMCDNVRTTDIVIVRYGGDEFVLIMPETNLSEATVLLERLRRQIKAISIPKASPFTISCGAAEWLGLAADTPETVLSRADNALYEAKRTGRNRVVTARTTANTI